MKHLFSLIFSSAIAVLILSSCAGNPADSIPLEEKLERQGYVIGQPIKRINNYQVNGWASVDLKHIIINFGPSRDFLVTLRSPCVGVLDAASLAFSTTIGYLSDKDKLLVRDDGGHLSNCFIDTIHELEKIKKTDPEQT